MKNRNGTLQESLQICIKMTTIAKGSLTISNQNDINDIWLYVDMSKDENYIKTSNQNDIYDIWLYVDMWEANLFVVKFRGSFSLCARVHTCNYVM